MCWKPAKVGAVAVEAGLALAGVAAVGLGEEQPGTLAPMITKARHSLEKGRGERPTDFLAARWGLPGLGI